MASHNAVISSGLMYFDYLMILCVSEVFWEMQYYDLIREATVYFKPYHVSKQDRPTYLIHKNHGALSVEEQQFK